MSHNTILEAMSALGLVGLAGLGLHTYMKYKTCIKNDLFFFITLIAVIGTECYGLIDCVMPSPYYVIPLFILLINLDKLPEGTGVPILKKKD